MSRRYHDVELSLSSIILADDPAQPEGAGEGVAHRSAVRAAPNPARLAVIRKLGGLFRGVAGGENRAAGGQIELPFDPPLQRGSRAAPWSDRSRGGP